MRANDYQEWTKSTVVYEGDNKMSYFTLGLVGEAGEVAEKVKKLMRDYKQYKEVPPTDKVLEIHYELGDVLWYLARLADFWGTNLENLMKLNKSKLESRKKRNKLHGEGDTR